MVREGLNLKFVATMFFFLDYNIRISLPLSRVLDFKVCKRVSHPVPRHYGGSVLVALSETGRKSFAMMTTSMIVAVASHETVRKGLFGEGDTIWEREEKSSLFYLQGG